MKQRTYEGLKFLIDAAIVALFVVWAVLWVKDAEAGGDKITQDVDQSVSVQQASDALAMNENAQNANNQNKTDNFSLGLANGLGDVDINDCLASRQWNTPLFGRQDTELNYWCAALHYDAIGLNEMAARLRCQMPEIKRMFKVGKQVDDLACIVANTVPKETSADVVESLTPMLQEQQAIITEYEALTAALTDRVKNLEEEAEKQRKRAQRPQAKPQTIIKQESRYTDEEREAILALKFE